MSAVSKYENKFQEAFKKLRSTNLTGVDSPFYTAALYCQSREKFKEARCLLKQISKDHWQFIEALDLKDILFEQELSELRGKSLELKAENLRLRSLSLHEPFMPKLENKGSFKEMIDKIMSVNSVDIQPPSHSTPPTPMTFSFAQKAQPQPQSEKPKTPDKKIERPMKLH